MQVVADQFTHAPTRRFTLPPDAIERISTDAAKMKPSKAMLGALGFLIVGLVWCVGVAWRALFFLAFRSGAWVFAAGKMGWLMSQGKPLDTPTLEEVLRENDALRKALARVDPGG